jgi:hypothetical protein
VTIHVGERALACLAVCGIILVAVVGSRHGAHHGYERGEVLRYLPESCPSARVYVDMATLWTEVGSPELAAAAHEGGPLRELVRAFDAAGIDLRVDITDIAFCAQSIGADEDERSIVFVAIGGALGGDEALQRYRSVIMALSHVDASSIIEDRRDGVPYVVSKYRLKRDWIAMPAANVLVFSTEDVAAVAGLRTSRVGDRTVWRADASTSASFEYRAPGTTETSVTGRIADDHGVVAITGLAHFEGLRNLDATKLATIRDAAASVLTQSALRSLAAPVGSMVLAIEGGALRFELRPTAASVAQALVEVARDPRIVRTVVADLAQRP